MAGAVARPVPDPDRLQPQHVRRRRPRPARPAPPRRRRTPRHPPRPAGTAPIGAPPITPVRMRALSDLGVDRAHLAGDLGTAFTFDGRQIVLPLEIEPEAWAVTKVAPEAQRGVGATTHSKVTRLHHSASTPHLADLPAPAARPRQLNRLNRGAVDRLWRAVYGRSIQVHLCRRCVTIALSAASS